MYRSLGKMLAWIFPQEDRQQFCAFCKSIDTRRKGNKAKTIAHKNYLKLLPTLQKEYKNRKLKVCFLCHDNAKWSYQSLYEAFDKSEHFTPLVLVSITTDLLGQKHIFLDYKKKLAENYNFFASRGMKVSYAFDVQRNKFINQKCSISRIY